MSDARVSVIRESWQTFYKTKYNQTHYWAAKEQKWTTSILKYADENYPTGPITSILDAMESYLKSKNERKHGFAEFASNPQRWFAAILPKREDNKAETAQEPTPREFISVSDECLAKTLSDNPEKHLRGFKTVYKTMKKINPSLYQRYVDFFKTSIPKEKRERIWNETTLVKVL